MFGTKALEELGYADVASWTAASMPGKPLPSPGRNPPASPSDQRRRYSRHFLLPEVGEDGQRKLLDAKVLLIGAGGLGSPAALYLAAAGVGTLGIVDDDVVDDSNLQRQVLIPPSGSGCPRSSRPRWQSTRSIPTSR